MCWFSVAGSSVLTLRHSCIDINYCEFSKCSMYFVIQGFYYNYNNNHRNYSRYFETL